MDIAGKKFYISVDLEGCACTIGAPGRSLAADTSSYSFACLQGTREANAAAKALFDLGAAEVWIWDCHGSGYNLNYDMLDKRCKIVMGVQRKGRFPMIDSSFAGVLFIGYHAYDSIDATLCHVYSSATYQHQKINGCPVGELQIDAAVAGEYGVPVLFVSSDDICVAQALETFPNAETVVTKKALSWNGCISDHPDTVCDNIYAAVTKAAQRLDDMLAYTVSEPFEYEMRFKRIETCDNCVMHDMNNKLFERVDAYTRRGMLSNINDIFEY